MNENYLWNKTGEDAEIKRLENALQAFRCRNAAPPAVVPAEILPAAVLPFRERPARRIFPLAAAACIAFVLIGLAMWLQTSNNKTGTSSETAEAQTSKFADTVETNAPPLENTASDFRPTMAETNHSTAKNTKVVNIKKSGTQKSSAKQRFGAIYKIVPASFGKSETAARNETAKRKTENRNLRLTEDEQYAYSQLLLALSITNSKLALVKDKLEDVREQTPVLKDRR